MAAHRTLLRLLLVLLLSVPAGAVAQTPPAPPSGGFLTGVRDVLQSTRTFLGGAIDAGVDQTFGAWLIDPAAQWALPLPAGPAYRPKHPRHTPVLDESRLIVDEMLANQYRDVFFHDALRRSQGFARRAAGYVRACQKDLFVSSAAELARLRLATQQRKDHLDDLAGRLRSGVMALRAALHRAHGRSTSGEELVGTAGSELFFAGAQAAMEELADLLDRRPRELRLAGQREWVRQLNLNRMPASPLGRLTRLGSRVLGVVNTVQNLWELADGSQEAMQMMALIPHLAEWEALAIYLEGLSAQYARLLRTQQELFDQLSGQFDAHACQRCVKPPVTPPPVPQPVQPPGPRRPPVRPAADRPLPAPPPVRPPVRPTPAPPPKPGGG